MIYFNSNGRRVPTAECRVFSSEPQNYYRLEHHEINYSRVLKNSIKHGGVDSGVSLDNFQESCEKLKNEIGANKDFKNLLGGAHIPFICKRLESSKDLGRDLVEVELPSIQSAFTEQFPESHFKAVLQSNSKLPGSIKIDPRARYESFLEKCSVGHVIGWYFPQALQEFDAESQRKQMTRLPDFKNLCLSGGVDIAAAIIGTPDLLISDKFYAPILCMSAYVHFDPRLILVIKSYGPHLEFWCMTQMLSKNVVQVSEQWSGGMTIYALL